MARNETTHVEECAILIETFMKVKDRKARSKILRLAGQCAYFDGGGIISFGDVREQSARDRGPADL
jgi:hypothetical protein